MFLFDKSRHGRQKFASLDNSPSVFWKTDLRTNPVYGAESTTVIDTDGNLYFGSHSGNFYSLDKNGKIRWSFSTSEKIYASPIIIKERVLVAGGDGFLYCFGFDGELKWKFDLGKQGGKMSKKKKIENLLHMPFTYDFNKKRNIIYRCWSSPNLIDDKIYITAYGVGFYCIDIDGKEVWSFDLGFPRYQLSGVAINKDNLIFLSSRSGKIFSFKPDGSLRWERLIRKNWEPWGNPVVCDITDRVYFFFSKKEKHGLVYCTDISGNKMWETEIGSIRGSCCVSWDGTSIFCCDLDGWIYRIKAQTGEIENRKKITNTKEDYGLRLQLTLKVTSCFLQRILPIQEE
jgi:outer membrane protein assembly factor BamB